MVGQVSSKLRRTANGYSHWCPACEEMHQLPDSWTFVNHDLERPTFTPSFLHTGVRAIWRDGEWTGEFVRDAAGKPVPLRCHYILTDGILNFCADCAHAMAGKSVSLPDLPVELRDP